MTDEEKIKLLSEYASWLEGEYLGYPALGKFNNQICESAIQFVKEENNDN
ncbi:MULTISPECIES: hypothetical protein [unclassified Leuconostoc]|nr:MULTISPECIES: hypothetical protein [unclassified Leuconostoc]MBK0041683.1 hypothetical protein [Leuconostoc sp. S51]MBK0052143.1 hypothetical protein [Leuconostoc sp. S50]